MGVALADKSRVALTATFGVGKDETLARLGLYTFIMADIKRKINILI